MAVSPPTTDIGFNTKKLYPISCLSCHVTKDQQTHQRVGLDVFVSFS